MKPAGITPAVALINPNFPHNVGAAVRAASCFDVRQVWYTGNRVSMEPPKSADSSKKGSGRLPREERMKGFRDVELRQFDYFLDQFPHATPVAVEVRKNSENLITFEHPENPLYIFGPEDGNIPSSILALCHRFVMIPVSHCTNLAAAINLVLYDRRSKLVRDGKEPLTTAWDVLNEVEHRGWWDSNPEEAGLVRSRP
jgi:tRNA(Leu) C34 or U34 (ribose-2'-O)-methylase TrmL